MPASKSFRDFLEEKAREGNEVTRRQQRQEWVDAVNRLVSQLSQWLTEADPKGVLEVERVEFRKAEEEIGSYQVPGLDIRLGCTAGVRIMPVGRNVVGSVAFRGAVGMPAEGRVDLTDGFRKYTLYRPLEGGERWHVVDDRYNIAPLDQARFEAI